MSNSVLTTDLIEGSSPAMDRRPAAHLARAAELRAFIAHHGRLPRRTEGGLYCRTEGGLYAWLKRVENGSAAAVPPDLATEICGIAQAARAAAPPNLDGMVRSNAARTATAAQRTVPAAQAVLERCSARHLPVLLVRIERPDATLEQLAGQLGITKHAYAARLRRALAAAGR